MRLLVTGGCGFIGSNLVRYLLASRPDWQLVNLDKLTYAGNLESLRDLEGDPRHVFVRGDIGDRALVTDLLAKHQIDAVVHLAAESHVDRSILGPEVFAETNVVGTSVLLEASRKARGEALPDGLDRRGVRLAGPDRLLHRDHAARPLEPVLGVQGRLRPAGAGLPPHVRPARAGQPLLATTTAPTSSPRS